MKIGILGAGGIARTMARTLNEMKDVKLYAVASRSQEKADQFAAEFQAVKAYGSYEAMLQDKEVELVYIATPHSHHYTHMKLCLKYGKHVLCEKSFTQNAAQAQEVLKLAEQKGLLCTEAIWPRYMPMARVIRQILESGEIGAPAALSANLGYPIFGVERIRRPELAGGAFLDICVYVLTFASLFFGDDISRIDSSVVMADTGVDSQESITLTYRDGRIATLYCTAQALTDRQGVISGSEGFLVVENINNFQKADIYDHNRRLIRTVPCPPQITGYEYEVASAVKAIQEGKTECPEMPHSETLFIMRLMDSLRDQWGMKYPNE